MDNYEKLVKAQKIVIKQYAYGSVRIDDGINIKNGNGGNEDNKPTDGTGNNHYAAFGVVANIQAAGVIRPMIYLPPRDALVLNGENIPVQPLGGALQNAQCLYQIPPNTDLWCAVTKDINGNLVAKLYRWQDIPPVTEFLFHVAKVPRNLMRSKVVQFVYGTVFASTDKEAFQIVADGKAINVNPGGGGDGGNGAGGNGDAGEVEPVDNASGDYDGSSDDDSENEEVYVEETPWDDYDPDFYDRTHHFEKGYYMMGGVLYKMDIPESLKVESFAGKYVCLKVPTTADSSEHASIVGFDELTELQATQRDPAYFVKPLYKLDSNGAVEVDLRNPPAVQVSEILG